MPRKRTLVAGLAVGAGVLGGLALSPAATLEALRGTLRSPWFPAVLVGLYLARPLLAWPISALSVLVGYRYGATLGFAIAMAGVVATSLIPYAAARALRTDAGWFGEAAAAGERFFGATGDLRGVVAARLAPVPAEVISGGAGVAGVSTPAFVAGTLVGELPWTGAAVLAGASMRRLSVSGVGADPRLVVLATLAAAVLLAGPAYRVLSGTGRNSR
ncbi:MAG: TVP38/TMEM64 family protein [Halobacteriales archaeon]